GDGARGHAISVQRESRAGQIGRAPFAVRGRDVEAEEGIPMPLFDGAAGHRVNLDAAGERGLALLANGLALARAEGGEKIIEALIALIIPVELLASALEEAGGTETLPLRP